jgi:hypothetical protein
VHRVNSAPVVIDRISGIGLQDEPKLMEAMASAAELRVHGRSKLRRSATLPPIHPGATCAGNAEHGCSAFGFPFLEGERAP